MRLVIEYICYVECWCYYFFYALYYKKRAKQCCVEGIGLTFWAWSGGAYRSVKNKKLFERSEFFLFSVEKCRSSPKSAALIFSFVTFLLHQGKRKSKITFLPHSPPDRRTSWWYGLHNRHRAVSALPLLRLYLPCSVGWGVTSLPFRSWSRGYLSVRRQELASDWLPQLGQWLHVVADRRKAVAGNASHDGQ